jgi:UDP-glucose 4-epimerase
LVKGRPLGRVTGTKPKRILVAGGRGFLGGRIAAYLAEAGHQIILGSRSKLSAPPWLPKAKTVSMYWDDLDSLQKSCEHVDVVIHAAGMNAKECALDPVNALITNGVATTRLVEAAHAKGVETLIYLSTAHVYASPLTGVITEEACPKNLHPYATSHLAGESAVLNANALSILNGIVIRLSNAVGAPMDDRADCWDLLANDLCRQAVIEGKLVLQTNGQQQRDFVAISEICQTIRLLTETDGNSGTRGLFNCGSGTSRSILAIAELVQQRCYQVLGAAPSISKKEDIQSHTATPLVYQSTRLAKLGALMTSEITTEIDQLLAYCNRKFGSSPCK